MREIQVMVVILVIAFLTMGCFEEQKNYDTNIEGIWIGELIPDKGGSIGTRLFVLPDNRCYLVVSDPTSYISERLGGYGVFNVENGLLTASIKVYSEDGKPVGEMNIANGRIELNEERVFTAHYSSDDEYLGNGEVSLAVDDSYKMYSSLSRVAGTWGFSSASGVEIMISINNGSMNGVDDKGCIFNGSISVIDNKHNLYDVNHFIITNCSEDKNGEYKGLATLMDSNHMLLVVVKTDETYGFIMHLTKQ